MAVSNSFAVERIKLEGLRDVAEALINRSMCLRVNPEDERGSICFPAFMSKMQSERRFSNASEPMNGENCRQIRFSWTAEARSSDFKHTISSNKGFRLMVRHSEYRSLHGAV